MQLVIYYFIIILVQKIRIYTGRRYKPHMIVPRSGLKKYQWTKNISWNISSFLLKHHKFSHPHINVLEFLSCKSDTRKVEILSLNFGTTHNTFSKIKDLKEPLKEPNSQKTLNPLEYPGNSRMMVCIFHILRTKFHIFHILPLAPLAIYEFLIFRTKISHETLEFKSHNPRNPKPLKP